MRNKLFVALTLLVIASFALSACGQKVVKETVVVKETSVVKETVKETSVVETTVKETVVVPATAEPVAPSAKTPVLRINIGTYPDIIDPQKSSFVNEIAHLQMIYQGLTTYNEKLETVPGSAEKWEFNADATELVFTLRKDLKYSDGSLLNAKRFEYSIKRNIDPTTGGEYASITDEILGAPEWRTGKHADGTNACAADECTDDEKATLAAAIGVQALDSTGAACTGYDQADCLTLKVTLSKPAPYFHTVMGLWVTFPAKEELIAEGGANWWNSSKYHVGNGPFILKNLEPFVRAYLVPNPNYWMGTATYDLEYSYITDSALAFQAYKNNELDIVASASEDLAVIQADPELNAQHLLYAGSCTNVIRFGLAAIYKDPNGKDYESPFKEKKVREAFAYAFDAEGWARDVDMGLSVPAWSWIPPGYPGYDATSPLKFDPEAAKAALAESSFGGPEKLNALGLKLTFGDTPRNRTRSEWLVQKFKDVLGVDIALDPIEPTAWTALTKDAATFPLLARQGWCADYPDPQNWLSVYWRSNTSFAQRQGYNNPEFDKLVDEADTTLDPVKRIELYKQAQQLLLADVPSAFGYNTTNHYLVKPWVKGISTTPQDSAWAGQMVPLTISIDTTLIP